MIAVDRNRLVATGCCVSMVDHQASLRPVPRLFPFHRLSPQSRKQRAVDDERVTNSLPVLREHTFCLLCFTDTVLIGVILVIAFPCSALKVTFHLRPKIDYFTDRVHVEGNKISRVRPAVSFFIL